MTALQAALRANRIPTCVFSNTNGLAIDHIRLRFPFFANFDHYILSYELRAMNQTRPATPQSNARWA